MNTFDPLTLDASAPRVFSYHLNQFKAIKLKFMGFDSFFIANLLGFI